jgi:hypothetical protein
MAAAPESFGAGIAQAVGQVGDRLQARALQANEITLRNRYENDLTQAHAQLAQMRLDMVHQTQAIRTDPSIAVDQHEGTVLAAFDAQKQILLNSIANPKIREALRGQVDLLRESTGANAFEWQSMQQTGKTISNISDTKDLLSNAARMLVDPKEVDASIAQYQDMTAHIAGLTPDQRINLAKEGGDAIKNSYGLGLADDSPDAAAALLKGGYFSDLPPEKTAILDRTIRLSTDRIDAARLAAAKTAQAAVIGEGQAMLRTIDGGGTVPLDAIGGMAARLKAVAGDDAASLVDRLGLAGITLYVNARFGNLPPAQIEHAAAAAEAKVSKLGDHVPESVGAQARALRTLANRQSELATSDPWQLAPKFGIVATPIDLASPQAPQQLQQRIGQAAMLASAIGHGYAPQILQRNEAEQAHAILSKGNSVDQLNLMHNMALAGPRAADAMFNQLGVDGGKRAMTLMFTGSNPQAAIVARQMLEGETLIKTNPALTPGAQFTSQATAQLAQAVRGNAAIIGADPHMASVIDLAKMLYTSDAAHAGAAPPSKSLPINTSQLNGALDRALGAWTDGAGLKHGGLGDHNGTMILPDMMTQPYFDAGVANALPQALRAAGIQGSAGIMHDLIRVRGAVTPFLELDNAQFQMVGDGRYKILTGGSWLANRQGQAAIWNARTKKVEF